MAKRSTTDDRARGATSRKRARSGPEPLGRLLGHARDTAARRAGVGLDHETWREVAGDRIALRTAPGGIEGGVLTVVVTSPVWAQELSFLAEDIVEKLKARGLGVASIRFRTGPVQPPPASAPARRIPRPVELSSDAKERLAKVEDPVLREIIAAAMGQSLANQARGPERALRPKPTAPDPRSAEPGSVRSGQAAPIRSARPRRNRGEH